MPSGYVGLPPQRIMGNETVDGFGGQNGTPFQPNERKPFPMTGRFGIPADATDVLVNITLPPIGRSGWIKAWASSEGEPETSVANPDPTVIKNSPATISLGRGGGFYLKSADLALVIVDLVGYFGPIRFRNSLGGDDRYGVAGSITAAQARQLHCRRYHNWDTWIQADQAQAVHAGEMIFYPTLLPEQHDYSIEEARQKAQAVVDAIGRGLSWIVGNEVNYANDPDNPGNPMPPETFQHRFNRAVAGIKQADPQAKIVGPSTLWWLQGSGRSYYERLMQTSVGYQIDIHNIHLYTAHHVDEASGNLLYWLCDPDAMMRELQDFRRFVGPNAEVIVSECGVIHGEGRAALPPDDPRVRGEVSRVLNEFVPRLEASGLANAWNLFISQRNRWNDQMFVQPPLGLYDENGSFTADGAAYAALARMD
jgi:hypothetical protein